MPTSFRGVSGCTSRKDSAGLEPATFTRHTGLLYLLSYKSIWSPDGEEDAPPGDWKGKREKKAREPALYSHAYIVKQNFYLIALLRLIIKFYLKFVLHVR